MNRNSAFFQNLPPSLQNFAADVHRRQYFFRKRLAARRTKRKNLGRGSRIDPDALVLGWRSVKIGSNVMISEGVVINVNNRDKAGLKVIIGDNSAINRDCYFVNGELIQLGEFTLFGPGCRLLGGNHVFDTPFTPYIASGNSAEGRIVLGANCWLGAGVTIIGDVQIGHGCVIGANALVLKKIPPFSIVVGSPARVTKRFDVISQKWIPAEEFTQIQEDAIPSEDEYLKSMRRTYPSVAMPFAASGRSRGDLA